MLRLENLLKLLGVEGSRGSLISPKPGILSNLPRAVVNIFDIINWGYLFVRGELYRGPESLGCKEVRVGFIKNNMADRFKLRLAPWQFVKEREFMGFQNFNI